jgi:spermidine/putrescine transport system permease protein
MTRQTRPQNHLLLLLFPATIWLILFFVIPLLIVLLYSFLQADVYGGVKGIFTLENYQRLFDEIYLNVLARSLGMATFTTLACLIIGYPLALFIVTRSPRWRGALLLLVVIPFWTNFLVRTYAWFVLLRNEGVINVVLESLQIINQPLELLFTPFAVNIGLIYGYLPFMILPLYTTLERFNFTLIEAAQDLGANDLRTFARVVLPLTVPGIISGSILVFIPALGAFITPDILGGAKTMMVGNLIQNQFMKSRDEPFGSALSMLLLVLVLIPILIYFRFSEEDKPLR